jgi:integrase
MFKRRLKDAGLSDAFSPHSFMATGITNFLENGGTLEVDQRIAGHADSRTTKLYDPTRAEDFARGYGTNSLLVLNCAERIQSAPRPSLYLYSHKDKR